MAPQPGPFDSLAAKYDSWYDGKGRVAFEIELAALRPLLAELPKPWLEVTPLLQCTGIQRLSDLLRTGGSHRAFGFVKLETGGFIG